MSASDLPEALDRPHDKTAHSYAAHLATYISSPLKIERLVALHFDKVPPLHVIAELRYRVERERKAFAIPKFTSDRADRDGEDYAPRSLVRRPQPRTYVNSRTVYVPKHVTLADSATLPMVYTQKEVVAAVAIAFGLTYEELRGPRRDTQAVCARSVAVRILRDRGNSTSCIARYVGRRDHSTILNLLRKFNARAEQHPQVALAYQRISELVA